MGFTCGVWASFNGLRLGVVAVACHCVVLFIIVDAFVVLFGWIRRLVRLSWVCFVLMRWVCVSLGLRLGGRCCWHIRLPGFCCACVSVVWFSLGRFDLTLDLCFPGGVASIYYVLMSVDFCCICFAGLVVDYCGLCLVCAGFGLRLL